MKTITEIADKIRKNLENVYYTDYFTVYGVSGEEIKIRTGDHSANRMNNGDTKTLSFVTNRTEQRKSSFNKMINEWEVNTGNWLTDTYQTIEEVLEWEDVSDDQEAAEKLNYELI